MQRPMTGLSIQFMYEPLPFPDRVRQAARDGFDAVEFWDWRDKDMDAIGDAAQEVGIAITGFFGNRLGSVVDRAEHARNLEGLHESLEVAKKVGAQYVHVFTNEIRPGGKVAPLSREIPQEKQYESVVEGLKSACLLAEGYGIPLLLEAINPVFVPGYFLADADSCYRVCQEVDHPLLPMIYDFYHQQLSTGNLVETFKRCLSRTEAVHIASVPGRHQPTYGEVNYRFVAETIREVGYRGLVTFEVVPKGTSEEAVEGIKEIFQDFFTRVG